MAAIAPLSTNLAFAVEAPDTQESHPGIGKESRYAEAVIAYNKKNTEEAVQILNELLKSEPKNIEYLELKALALKGKGDDKASIEIYRQLYEAKPEKERGPYAYEIASILEKHKRPDEAKGYFQKAIDAGFNVAASHLYIGLGAFTAGKYAEAESHFAEITDCGIAEIELVAQYYVSLCYFKMNFSTRGIQELVEAKDVARSMLKKDPKHENAKNIEDAANKMLTPFSKGQWFGMATLMTQYDSNIQTLPSGTTNTTATNTASTLKENLVGNIGYMSAPDSDFQLVTGYRASWNKNFNELTQGFEYFTNNASIYLNYRALAKTTYTIKAEGNFAFQNSLVDPTNSKSGYEYQKYNSTVGGGLAVRHQVGRYWRLEAEGNFRSQRFYADSNQTGTNMNFSVSSRRTGGDNFFNPGVSLLYEANNADGVLNYYKAYGLGLSNSMILAGGWILNQGFDFLFSNYTKTSPLRTDANYTIRVGAIRQMTAKISLLADLSYIKNYSSIEASYTYNRLMTSLGVGFSL